MKYFFDTEFIEDGRTIDLISIGVVAEDGREFYACNLDADLTRADSWGIANVLPHLPPRDAPAWKRKIQIAMELRRFVLAPGSKPEFWAYYADYDWVALCQLYGRMLDLPDGFPKFCMDLKQLSVMSGSPQHPKQRAGTGHHALGDAHWNRELYAFLQSKGIKQ